MASFKVYEDEENSYTTKNSLKVKTVATLLPNTVLAEINQNQIKQQPLNRLAYSKIPVYQNKDFSDALKQVKLDSKEDETKKKVRQHLPILEEDDASSDVSLNLSQSDLDPKQVSESKARSDNEELFDCVQYRDDIYSYLTQLELRYKPKPFYMRKQPDITDKMRSILVDWLVEVADEFKLHAETLFMSVAFIDRFLSTMSVTRTKLQLLGTAAMYVAAKYEEIIPPSVRDFTYITDDTYTIRHVLRMEILLLKTLNFEISGPTIYTFIYHLSKVMSVEKEISTLAQYICELTLLEGKHYLQYGPSLLACGAIALSRHCLHRVDAWPQDYAEYSGYSLSRHLSNLLPELNLTHAKAPDFPEQVIRSKYSSSAYYGVALIPHRPLVVRKLKMF